MLARFAGNPHFHTKQRALQLQNISPAAFTVKPVTRLYTTEFECEMVCPEWSPAYRTARIDKQPVMSHLKDNFEERLKKTHAKDKLAGTTCKLHTGRPGFDPTNSERHQSSYVPFLKENPTQEQRALKKINTTMLNNHSHRDCLKKKFFFYLHQRDMSVR